MQNLPGAMQLVNLDLTNIPHTSMKRREKKATMQLHCWLIQNQEFPTVSDVKISLSSKEQNPTASVFFPFFISFPVFSIKHTHTMYQN